MANKHTITTTYKSEGGTVTITTQEIEADKSINIERDLDIGVTDAEVEIAFAVADCKSWAIGCKKISGQASDLTAQATIKTNSSSTPDDTFNITAANGVGWANGFPTANPLTADVTTMFVSNTGTGKIELFGRFAIDATPTLPG